MNTSDIEKDAILISNLGGPAKVAERLGYRKESGVQRVQNWITRGIPAKVKIQFPDIFLTEINKQEAA